MLEGETLYIEKVTCGSCRRVIGWGFRGQLDALSDDARVFAPDLPGFGESTPLAGKAKDATIGEYAAELAGWARDMGLTRLTLAGHSMGGYVAMAFARLYPDMLSRLVLVCTRPGPDSDEGREGRYETAAAVKERGPQAVVDAMLPRLVSGATRESKPDVVERVEDMMLRQSEEGIVAALYAMAARPDSGPSLAQVEVPTLIITGAEDTIIPAEEAGKMLDLIPGSRHVEIAGAAHMPMLEDAEAFNDALRGFLACT
jgi:pimeloyl-ACP methyl ester carboxylesterase